MRKYRGNKSNGCHMKMQTGRTDQHGEGNNKRSESKKRERKKSEPLEESNETIVPSKFATHCRQKADHSGVFY